MTEGIVAEVNYPTEIPIWLTPGTQVTVVTERGGGTYTVEEGGPILATLTGPRGGSLTLVENVHGNVLRAVAGGTRDVGDVEYLGAWE